MNEKISDLNSIYMNMSPKRGLQKKDYFRSISKLPFPLILSKAIYAAAGVITVCSQYRCEPLFQVGSSCSLRKVPIWNHCFPEGDRNQGRAALQKPTEKPNSFHTDQNWMPVSQGTKKWGRPVSSNEGRRAQICVLVWSTLCHRLLPKGQTQSHPHCSEPVCSQSDPLQLLRV